MTEVLHSRSIAAPASAVWSVLADFAQLANWAPVITHSSAMTQTSEGVGTMRRVAIGRTILLERITEWEPEKILAYELEGLPPIIASAVNRWVLDDQGASTSVSLTAVVEPGPRPPMKAAAAVAARRIGATNSSLLDCLAVEAEKIGAKR
jgi:uncharacterized protein YndB with AHSA1/START domain